jgi:hypothetical protein
MNILVFDTETTSLDKPFCYNLGYTIIDLESHEMLLKKDFVVEQIWHNLALFQSAYYAEKRPLYINRMKAQKVKMTKYGHIMRAMRADIKEYNIEYAYAYNSGFDERVFDFNCDWYKVANPLDTVKVIDIRPIAVNTFGTTKDYKKMCEDLELFTDTGNYSTTAEAIFRYVSQNYDFEEEHTALNDSIIEGEILIQCYKKGIDITQEQKCARSLVRKQKKTLVIIKNGEVLAEYDCSGYTLYKKSNSIRLKD